MPSSFFVSAYLIFRHFSFLAHQFSNKKGILCMFEQALPERSQIPKAETWDVESIYPNVEAWQESFRQAQTQVNELHSEKQTKEFCLAITHHIRKLRLYAKFRLDEDTRRKEFQIMLSDADGLWASLSNSSDADTQPEGATSDQDQTSAPSAIATLRRFGLLLAEAVPAEYLQEPERPEGMAVRYAFLAEHRNDFAGAFDAILKDKVKRARMKGKPSALAATLGLEGIPVRAHNNILHASRNHIACHQSLLNLLDRCNDSAVSEQNPTGRLDIPSVSYSQAQELIVQACAPLGSQYQSGLMEAFSCRWIDHRQNKGKQWQPYCNSALGIKPFVLVNFDGTMRSVWALGHELGHAMNMHFTAQAHPEQFSRPPIITTEMAAVVNEILLRKYCLAQAKDNPERRDILLLIVRFMAGKLFTAARYADFEQMAFNAVEAGDTLTAALLSELYTETLRTYRPDLSKEALAEQSIGWADGNTLSFGTFYLYSYPLAELLAEVIVSTLLTERDSAILRYNHLLSSGGYYSANALLYKFGIDLYTATWLDAAFIQFTNYLDELESLV